MNGLVLSDGGYSIRYANEFDIRDGLATLARIAGWRVDTEHVVPGWGRPDLYLSAGDDCYAVEVKIELDTASKCRKAIQQAASYRRALPELSDVILTAATVNWDAMAEYSPRYSEVKVMSVRALMRLLTSDHVAPEFRQMIALDRFRQLEDNVEIARRVLAEMSELHGSRIGVNVDATETTT